VCDTNRVRLIVTSVICPTHLLSPNLLPSV